ncbi:hypothetical protein GE061_010369 [Apolygus lucorum]|uniref:Uncharacterized protein n=1 Tax=Apolygus lucorum TaxID=248454 RepID=A0A8S9Y361_APOLU|nr:hypothetical protein GE061_010369 [Apolygus lucorum]
MFGRKPLDRLCENVLEQQAVFKDLINDSFIEHLNTVRGEAVATKQCKRKLTLPPGKGITANDLQDARKPPENKKKKGAVTKSKMVKPKKQKRARRVSVSSSASSSPSVSYAESDDSLPNFSSSEDEDSRSPQSIQQLLHHHLLTQLESDLWLLGILSL